MEALRVNSSSSSFTPSCYLGLPLSTLKCCDLSRVLPTYRTSPSRWNSGVSAGLVFIFVLNKIGWRIVIPSQKLSHGKIKPGPGHSGSGKNNHVPMRSVTCVSHCEVVLASDQRAEGAELLSSGHSRANLLPWAFLFQSVT